MLLQLNGAPDDNQEELSRTNSSSDTSYSGSGDVSKLSSSQHSSVKSLVEEKDKPAIQQAESMDVNLQMVTDSTHQAMTDSTHETVTDSTHEEVTDSTHEEVTDSTHEEVTDSTHKEVTDSTHEEVTDSTHEEVTDSTHEEELDDGEMDPVEKENMEKELEVIAKATENYLKTNGNSSTSTAATPSMSNNKVIDEFTDDLSMRSASKKGLNSSITEIIPEPVKKDKEQSLPKTESKTTTTTQNQSQGIDLSFLDDLQAQVMDVLDDTISFDPTNVPPPPPVPKKPEIKKLPPPVPVKKTSTDETDSVFVPMSPSKSKTLPHRRSTKDSYSPFEIRPRNTSDSDNMPNYRRNTIGNSPLRQKPNRY